MVNITPTEAAEQKALVLWLRAKGYKHFRVPNETYTKSWRQKANNKALGVVPGVPDMFVIANNKLIAIELKRIKGSKTSPEQLDWIQALHHAGVPAAICLGAQQAIAFIEDIVNPSDMWPEQPKVIVEITEDAA